MHLNERVYGLFDLSVAGDQDRGGEHEVPLRQSLSYRAGSGARFAMSGRQTRRGQDPSGFPRQTRYPKKNDIFSNWQSGQGRETRRVCLQREMRPIAGNDDIDHFSTPGYNDRQTS